MPKGDFSIKVPGTILFSRYAFSPNRLKYCGPDANLDLFEYTSRQISDPGLVNILSEFEAAYPYLEFIAQENRINDPFDLSVVEAYWIGNDLLNQVNLNQFYYHLKDRFKKRIKSKSFEHVSNKIALAAKPYHAFHVFEILPKIGGIKGIDLGPVLITINSCMINPGQILKVEDEYLEVQYHPLIFDRKLIFAKSEAKKIEYKFKDKSFISNPRVGDWVAFHWNWACDFLSPRQLVNLKKWTLYHLKLANLTI
jgi:hypothetical protein